MAFKAVGVEIVPDEFEFRESESPYQKLQNLWPWLYKTYAPCPVAGCRHILYGGELVFHPFDIHVMSMFDYDPPSMTIDDLADFISRIEPKEDQSVASKISEQSEVPSELVASAGL